MKINKKNPLHWLWLGLLSVNVVLAVIVRKFVSSNGVVVLYGHKLNGNLAAIYRESREYNDLNLVYLTMDYHYYRKLKGEGISVAWGGGREGLKLLVDADILVSDHGLHSLVLLLDHSSIRFVDVWHGIPFKGFDKEDFKIQHRYSEVWLPSSFVANLYEGKFGFPKESLHVIGYARTDVLVNSKKVDRAELMQGYGIPVSRKKIVLYAPTWQQDDKKRSLYPFGLTELEFLELLSQTAKDNDCLILVRAHLNASFESAEDFENIYAVAADDYPDTERLLLLTDILIYDWSSIAFDFLLLRRPAIYFDVPHPFKKGFSLGGSFRFGEAVNRIDDISAAIARGFLVQGGDGSHVDNDSAKILHLLYGSNADGASSARACQRLMQMSLGYGHG